MVKIVIITIIAWELVKYYVPRIFHYFMNKM